MKIPPKSPDWMKKVKRAGKLYNLFDENDHIAVGISGGKDSMLLLYSLWEFRRQMPVKFRLSAIFVDMGNGMDISPLRETCRLFGTELHVAETNIAEVVFNIRKEKNPCSLCAKMRRGALYAEAKKIGANKAALGHHLDDAVETLFMSMVYEGNLRCFSPSTWLDRQEITVIRPLILVREKELEKTASDTGIPVLANPCPADGRTRREDMKKWLALHERENPLMKDRVMSTLINHIWR